MTKVKILLLQHPIECGGRQLKILEYSLKAAILMSAAGLAGCGGGGSATGGSPSVPGVPTTSKLFPLAANSTTKKTAIGREFAFSFKAPVLLGEETTASKPTGPEDVPVEVSVDASGDINSAKVKTLHLTGTQQVGEDERGRYLALSRESGSDEAGYDADAIGFIDPESEGFSYQTFGLWSSIKGDRSPTGGNGAVGAFSVGNQTANSDVPKTGKATFHGISDGWHTNGDEIPETVSSDVTLEADFANRKVDFQSVVTRESRTHLGMTGTMTYAAGSNSMSGHAITNGGSHGPALEGTIDGRFYGNGSDAAREIGGTFALTSPAETYVGAYGANR